MDKIKGVIIKKLEKYDDYRGWLCEVYRKDEDEVRPAMGYVSYTKCGVVRGPHEHKRQSDFFVFAGFGDFELHMWDNRRDSETYKNHMMIVVGESNRCSVLIPPGVVHGYKSISKNGSFSINLPDQLYRGEGKKGEVDEIRHENNQNSEFKIK
ncbi:dTDP-4-dehydrorhamnose 3,5-epimerase [Candidatus Woesearchaeota archaeon]|nr:MAG: dTDP-4-dehydrorhamnose 3,5-epimerase [Candidatus Woesearchaeota archaeon]